MRERGRLTRMPFLIVKIENGCIGILAYGNSPVKKKCIKDFRSWLCCGKRDLIIYFLIWNAAITKHKAYSRDVLPDEKRRCRHSAAALAMILDKKIVLRDDFVARYGMPFQKTERHINREDAGARCDGLHRKRLAFRRDMGNQQRA